MASAVRRACCPSSAGIGSYPSSAIADTSIRRVSASSSTTSTRSGSPRRSRILFFMTSPPRPLGRGGRPHALGPGFAYVVARPLSFTVICYLNDKNGRVDRLTGHARGVPLCLFDRPSGAAGLLDRAGLRRDRTRAIPQQLERDAAARHPIVVFLDRRVAIRPAALVHGHGARVLAAVLRPVPRRDADEFDERTPHTRLPAAPEPRPRRGQVN